MVLTPHRFLWVVLQLDCLCKNDIETDESIRRSLQDMPKDLYTLFSRILQRANVTGPQFQSRLLKIIVAAQRPLTVDEMREALSIVPADATWRPQQQINNIAHALTCCGSLITVDEEEDTVRLVHQSVSQFLLRDADTETTSEFHFTFDQASLELGQLLVTYLSYGVFDRQLSTAAIPNISVGQTPTAVVQHTLRDGTWKKSAALKLLRLRRQRGPDLGKIITEVSGAYQRNSETQQNFHFLGYASKHWLLHTRTIDSGSLTFTLWRDLLAHPIFGEELRMASRGSLGATSVGSPEKSRGVFVSYKAPVSRLSPRFSLPLKRSRPLGRGIGLRPPWWQYWTDVYHANDHYTICKFHPRMIWIITNSHLGLLSIELKGKQALKALCATVVYLLTLHETKLRPRLDRPMWEKLGKFATALRMKGLATEISQLCDSGVGRLREQHDLRELYREELREYLYHEYGAPIP